MDAGEIKDFIINNDKIELVLNATGCHRIREYETEYRCALPDRTNPTAVQVKKHSLATKVYKEDDTIRGDIITLIMFLEDLQFIEGLKRLHEILGLDFKKTFKSQTPKFNPLALFDKLKYKHHDLDLELKIYHEEILKPYVIFPHIELIREGIAPATQIKYKIGYCPEQKRILFPHRYYCGEPNDYVGLIGRTTIPNYDVFGVAKYFPLVKFPKGRNLYGYQENYSGIQETNMVVVVEGEKSVLKGDTMKHYNMVAIGGHDITPIQEKILLGLNVEIVIAFDKGISEQFITDTCKRFSKYRKVSYIFDDYGLLQGTDSPVDKGLKVYNYLLKNRKLVREEVEIVESRLQQA